MSKDVIQNDGEAVIAREDTVKAFRGVHWALLSIGVFVVITAILFFVFFLGATQDGFLESPFKNTNSNSR